MEKTINTNQFSFKCGEMKIELGKVKPSNIKGKVQIYKNLDNLLCWQWVSEDLKIQNEPIVIFSDEWEWIKVPVSKGRVYQLKSKCFEDTFIYWLQETDLSNDKNLEDSIVKILKEGKVHDQEVKVNTNNNQNLMDTISNALRQTRSKFLNLEKMPGLKRLLSTKIINQYLLNDDFINEAIKHLPDGHNTKEHYLKTITSPQFPQALSSLTEALNSENYGVILASFGLDIKDAVGAKDGVEGFIRCIIKKFKKN